MDEEFRLSNDETMRRLRTLSQAPGELQWRLELLATMERMRVQQEVTNRNILQLLTKVRKDVSHLTPTKLAELMNAQIAEQMKPRDKDLGRLWKAGVWILEKAATVAIGALCAWVAIKRT